MSDAAIGPLLIVTGETESRGTFTVTVPVNYLAEVAQVLVTMAARFEIAPNETLHPVGDRDA